jgi:PAS domain S-box-containing protein
MQFDKRKSGISLVGDLPWGSHFCQFYKTKKDLLDIFVPYLRAGLENNELCVWMVSDIGEVNYAIRELGKGIPGFENYLEKGQIEIIPVDPRSVGGEMLLKAIAARVDIAVTSNMDGLRLACCVPTETKGWKTFSSSGIEAMRSYSVIVLFAYPHGEFDALGLMEIVKNHQCALVRNAGRWELIESSDARTVRDALKRSEEKFQSLFSNMSEGFAYHRIVLDAGRKPCDYVFLEVNDAFDRLTGLKGEDIIGKRATEVLPGIEKDPTDWIEKYGRVALTGRPVQFESYSETLKRWYSVSAFSPHRGYFAVTFGDITERKRAEESLVRAKEEWELTFDSVPDMIMILDNHHRIMRVNKAMAAPRKERRGVHWSALL